MDSREIAIVLVNWNNFSDTAECIESLERSAYGGSEVIVVDNASDGDDARLLRERFGGGITLIETERNWGFAGGCNIGIRHALERGARYVALLNNDTVVSDRFLDELLDVARGDSKVGIAGGKIYCQEYPELIWFAGGTIDYRTGRTPIRGSGEADRGQHDEIIAVDWICSCFMLVSSEMLRTVGLFDERFFFGWEDVDLCVRAAKSGYKVLYVPGSWIWHKGFGEVKRERLRGRPLYYAMRGHLIFVDKHFTRSQQASAALHFVLRFPKLVWDYARITRQWRAPLYMLRALFDFCRVKCASMAKTSKT